MELVTRLSARVVSRSSIKACVLLIKISELKLTTVSMTLEIALDAVQGFRKLVVALT